MSHPDVALFLLRFLCIIVNVQSHKGNSVIPDIHQQLRALLDKESAAYRVVEHEPEGRTEMIAKIRGNRIEQSIKSIVVQVRLNRKENIYCLANVPGDCRIDFDGIKSYFHADSVAFASREKAQELTGCAIGAIPPFSFSDRLQVLADPLIQENEEIVFNAGRLDRSIFMKLDDYIRIAKPQFLNIALRG
jgi:Ala-tRNA(Pro) deacylase